ncbi:MAG: N-acetyltransferase [Clostridia bacterium]|nr:N-acetyltransferase [Clostridia bacterium]
MIRNAKATELLEILKVYDAARDFMRKNGNPTQWANGYPSEAVLTEDIEKNRLFVLEENGKIIGVFMFTLDEEPTYKIIENGAWLDSSLYGTIHRVASSGARGGVLNEVITFCEDEIRHLRIDTHKDNTVMQNLLLKNGFSYCGIIYLESGDERLAYEKTDKRGI